MLLNLHVKNLAIIDEVDIDFSGGFNVLTGETGAGKSIILGSINLALGAKVSKDIIRNGADFALVELVFSFSDDHVRKILENNDIECGENEVIITRKITMSRSISKVNGETVTNSFVQELAPYLIDIHGQHDNRMLIDASEHINILDDFIGDEAYDILGHISDKYKEFQRFEKKLAEIDIDCDKRLREISLLEYEINEIERANLREGEDEQLEEQFKLMSNMEEIVQIISQVSQIVVGDCVDSVSRAARLMTKIIDYSNDLCSINDSLVQAEDILSNVTREITDYLYNNEFNAKEFEDIEKRLDMINKFKSKYGSDIEKILLYCESNKQKLDILLNSDEEISRIKEEISSLEKEIVSECAKLTKLRKKHAEILCSGITNSLKELNFNDASFTMEFSIKDRFNGKGMDDAYFMIRSNAGEDYKPLSKVASGGELSRVMLAIKSVIADTQNMESFIFDEIDAGISGRTAQKVAQQLYSISKGRQIICITHLAQLAAMADNNYVIEKKVEEGRTFTKIRCINENEVTDELARIIGGTVITPTVIESAVEMKKLAMEYKDTQ